LEFFCLHGWQLTSRNFGPSSASFPNGKFLDALFQGAHLSYAEKHLIAGEIVQYETRLHWIVMLGHALIAAVLALVGVSLLITPWRVVYRGEAASGPLRWRASLV